MDELPIAECHLDIDGLRRQRDRYRRLGRSVRRVQREPRRLMVEFAPDIDADLIVETIAIESDCCPFFDLHYDAATREFVASVSEPEQAPALDALAAALRPDS